MTTCCFNPLLKDSVGSAQEHRHDERLAVRVSTLARGFGWLRPTTGRLSGFARRTFNPHPRIRSVATFLAFNRTIAEELFQPSTEDSAGCDRGGSSSSPGSSCFNPYLRIGQARRWWRGTTDHANSRSNPHPRIRPVRLDRDDQRVCGCDVSFPTWGFGDLRPNGYDVNGFFIRFQPSGRTRSVATR